MRVTTRTRVGNIVMLMRIKPKQNRKPVATAMTSNVPSPANGGYRPSGSVESGSLPVENEPDVTRVTV